MWSCRPPSEEQIRSFLEAQGRQAHPYWEVGFSRGEFPPGYHHDHSRVALGTGRAVFEAACAALRRWQMFPRPWTEIQPPEAPIQTGTVVAVVFHLFGLWCLNACRIVYVVDETQPTRRFGFAYGTLPGHVECGEERFTIEWDGAHQVWYDVRAFSRPRHWLARLGYPLARRMQRRFVRESLWSMRQAASQTSR